MVFTVKDIRQLLHRVNPFCELGSEELHPRVLKATSFKLAKNAYLVFRQSLDEGHLPSTWKEAIVMAIYKTGYRHLRGDLVLTYAHFGQGLTDRFFTVDPTNTRQGHVPNLDIAVLLPCLNEGNEPPRTIGGHENVLGRHWFQT
ncbi:hypothetical protein CLF_105366 [Clonorchis sinensis]|uniref:Uncharacterized protein n=1 Tax=Clonorchis sinensis TaxID=79923 RepID=G7YDG4_CLOSI|nr:hypothetical protein CLF_105366 [Clonorchis sinensis]